MANEMPEWQKKAARELGITLTHETPSLFSRFVSWFVGDISKWNNPDETYVAKTHRAQAFKKLAETTKL